MIPKTVIFERYQTVVFQLQHLKFTFSEMFSEMRIKMDIIRATKVPDELSLSWTHAHCVRHSLDSCQNQFP